MKRSLLLFFFAALATACQPQGATPVEYTSLQGLTLETPGITFPTESTVQLRAWGHFTDGSRVDLTEQTEWTSSVPSVGRIGPTGIAHLDGVGACRFEGRYEGKVVAVTLFATAATLSSLELISNDSGELPRGDTRVFHALAHYSDGEVLDVTSRATWTTDGSVLGAGAAGVVVAREQGEGVVQVRFGDQQLSKRIEVGLPRFRMLELQFPSTVIRPGDAHALTVFATYSDATRTDVTASATWTSSDVAVFEVGSTPGLVVARAAGRARITASWNGSTAGVQLDVFEKQVVTLGFERAVMSLPVGLTERVGLYADFDDGSRAFVSDGAIWTSSQPAVAEVGDKPGDKGVVTIVGQGTTTISATFGGLMATYQVNGLAPVLQTLNTTVSGGRLVPGQQVDFAVHGVYSDGLVVNLSGEVGVQHGVALVSSQLADRVVLTAVSAGPALIASEFGGVTHQLAFDVTTATITQLEVRAIIKNGPTTGQTVGQQRFRAWATYSDGAVEDVSELGHWWLDDADVAIMNDEPGARGTYGLARGGTTSVRVVVAGQLVTLVWDFPADI